MYAYVYVQYANLIAFIIFRDFRMYFHYFDIHNSYDINFIPIFNFCSGLSMK